MTRKKCKTEYHHGDLRAALIECGLELIEKKGIPALTLREIGKRLSVSRTAAYGHFKDKAALLSAISQAGFIEFENALEAAKKGAVGCLRVCGQKKVRLTRALRQRMSEAAFQQWLKEWHLEDTAPVESAFDC